MANEIPGLKLIYDNVQRVNEPDDPSFPFKLEISLWGPSEDVTFLLQHGSTNEVAIRSMTREAIEQLIDEEELRKHPRLHRLTITGPDGVLEQLPKADH